MNPARRATSRPAEPPSTMPTSQNSFTPGKSFKYASTLVATITAASTVTASMNIHSFEVRVEFRAAVPVVSSIHSEDAAVVETLCQKSDVAIYDLTHTPHATRSTPPSLYKSEERASN